jgi:hypothetical protein
LFDQKSNHLAARDGPTFYPGYKNSACSLANNASPLGSHSNAFALAVTSGHGYSKI